MGDEGYGSRSTRVSNVSATAPSVGAFLRAAGG
jgi:hypothetical protein